MFDCGYIGLKPKKAMVLLYEKGIIPHIQVHDELNISVENKSEALNIKNKMETCVDLHVPSKETEENEILAKIKELDIIQKYIKDKEISKTIYVKERLINIIVK